MKEDNTLPSSLSINELLIKYKDQKPKQFGGFQERCYPVSAVIEMMELYAQQLSPGTSDAVELLRSSLDELKNSRTVLKTLHDFPSGAPVDILNRVNEKASYLDKLIASIESFLQSKQKGDNYDPS